MKTTGILSLLNEISSTLERVKTDLDTVERLTGILWMGSEKLERQDDLQERLQKIYPAAEDLMKDVADSHTIVTMELSRTDIRFMTHPEELKR